MRMCPKCGLPEDGGCCPGCTMVPISMASPGFLWWYDPAAYLEDIRKAPESFIDLRAFGVWDGHKEGAD